MLKNKIIQTAVTILLAVGVNSISNADPFVGITGDLSSHVDGTTTYEWVFNVTVTADDAAEAESLKLYNALDIAFGFGDVFSFYTGGPTGSTCTPGNFFDSDDSNTTGCSISAGNDELGFSTTAAGGWSIFDIVDPEETEPAMGEFPAEGFEGIYMLDAFSLNGLLFDNLFDNTLTMLAGDLIGNFDIFITFDALTTSFVDFTDKLFPPEFTFWDNTDACSYDFICATDIVADSLSLIPPDTSGIEVPEPASLALLSLGLLGLGMSRRRKTKV